MKVVVGKVRWEKMDKTMARETTTTVKEVKTKGDGKRLSVLSLRGGWVGLPFSWLAFMLGGCGMAQDRAGGRCLLLFLNIHFWYPTGSRVYIP